MSERARLRLVVDTEEEVVAVVGEVDWTRAADMIGGNVEDGAMRRRLPMQNDVRVKAGGQKAWSPNGKDVGTAPVFSSG